MKLPTHLAGLAALCLASLNAHALCMIYADAPSTAVTAGADGIFTFISRVPPLSSSCPQYDAGVASVYVPYLADMGISHIATQSAAWSYTVEANNNLFGLKGGGVIHFYDAAPVVTDGLVFSFTAAYGGAASPDKAAYVYANGSSFQDTSAGLLMPGSPNFAAAAVPEPSPFVMLLGGLGLVGCAAARRRQRG